MKVLVSILLIITLAICTYIYLSNFRSAFEADQACHAIKSEDYGNSDNYGCDHDLETKQWLLYEKGEQEKAAVVLKRFRY